MLAPETPQVSFPYAQIMRELEGYDKELANMPEKSLITQEEWHRTQINVVCEEIFNILQTSFTFLKKREKQHLLEELLQRFPQAIKNSIGIQILLKTYSLESLFFMVAKLTYIQFIYGVKQRVYPVRVRDRLQTWMDKVPRSLDLQWTFEHNELKDNLSGLVGSEEIRWIKIPSLDLDQSLVHVVCEEHKKGDWFVFERYKQVLKRVFNQRSVVSSEATPLFSQHTSLLSTEDVNDQFVLLMYMFAEGAKEILEEET